MKSADNKKWLQARIGREIMFFFFFALQLQLNESKLGNKAQARKMQKMHMHDVESSPSGGEHSWIIQEYFPPRKSVVIQVEREADVRKPLFLMLMILIRSCCHMVSSNFALPRFP